MTPMPLGLFIKKWQPKVGLAGYDILFAEVLRSRSKRKMELDRVRKSYDDLAKQALDWNPQVSRRECRPAKTWSRTVRKEALSAGKT